MNKLAQFFQDGTGTLSMMRLCQFVAIMAIILIFVIANATAMYEAVRSATIVFDRIIDFPPEAKWVIGAVIAGKAAQTFGENKNGGGNASG
jgi:hypothetical protein